MEVKQNVDHVSYNTANTILACAYLIGIVFAVLLSLSYLEPRPKLYLPSTFSRISEKL